MQRFKIVSLICLFGTVAQALSERQTTVDEDVTSFQNKLCDKKEGLIYARDRAIKALEDEKKREIDTAAEKTEKIDGVLANRGELAKLAIYQKELTQGSITFVDETFHQYFEESDSLKKNQLWAESHLVRYKELSAKEALEIRENCSDPLKILSHLSTVAYDTSPETDFIKAQPEVKCQNTLFALQKRKQSKSEELRKFMKSL